MDGTLSPLLAFAVYLVAGLGLVGLGRLLGGAPRPGTARTTIYASGEAAPSGRASPGYGPDFATALFFAVLHLGVLVAASGPATVVGAVYVGGLLLILLVLVLG